MATKKAIIRRLDKDRSFIKLGGINDPKSMKIVWKGETLLPEGYTLNGSPTFPGHLADHRFNDLRTLPEISYEELEFTTPMEEFNTLKGIEQSLENLNTFKSMIIKRRLYSYWKPYDYLEEFIIFGKYLLDKSGGISIFHPQHIEDFIFFPNICSGTVAHQICYETGLCFLPIKEEYAKYVEKWAYIPNEGEKCPYCGKQFTINDLKNDGVDNFKGRISHRKCFEKHSLNKK